MLLFMAVVTTKYVLKSFICFQISFCFRSQLSNPDIACLERETKTKRELNWNEMKWNDLLWEWYFVIVFFWKANTNVKCSHIFSGSLNKCLLCDILQPDQILFLKCYLWCYSLGCIWIAFMAYNMNTNFISEQFFIFISFKLKKTLITTCSILVSTDLSK
jgi:hypothetical protein